MCVKAKSDIQTIDSALQMYKMDNYSYPPTSIGLRALVENPGSSAKKWRKGGYIRRLPKDPWDNEYQYMNPGNHMDVDVWSNGAT